MPKSWRCWAAGWKLGGLLSAHSRLVFLSRSSCLVPTNSRRSFASCAAGEISAFALTEPEVGSDPARLTTTAVLSEDGTEYILNGTKLWCTNGTLASLLVVMAMNPTNNKISAFVVEKNSPGVKVEHRCHFMGLKALAKRSSPSPTCACLWQSIGKRGRNRFDHTQ